MAKLRDQGPKMWEAYGIDPRTIIIKPGFNPRDTSSPEARKHIAWLKKSIAERGVDEPIFIENTGDKLVLIDGECRLRACVELWNDGTKVKVPTISYKGDEAAILAKSLVANNGLPLNQLELGKAADRLMAYGWSLEQIAGHIAPHLGFAPKKAQRFAKDAVEIHQAPLDVKEIVSKGVDGVKVSVATAIQEVRKNRTEAPAKLREAAAKAKAEGKKEVKRPKHPGPATVKKQAGLVALTALEAAEAMAQAVESWVEDATEKAEKKLVSTLKAFRTIVHRPKQPAKQVA